MNEFEKELSALTQEYIQAKSQSDRARVDSIEAKRRREKEFTRIRAEIIEPVFDEAKLYLEGNTIHCSVIKDSDKWNRKRVALRTGAVLGDDRFQFEVVSDDDYSHIFSGWLTPGAGEGSSFDGSKTWKVGEVDREKVRNALIEFLKVALKPTGR